MTEAAACAWCSRTFTPRATGGHAQRFCRPACRRAFDAAGRRWVAEAIATGMLTLDALRNGAPATRALLAGAVSPAPVSERKPAFVAPAEDADEAVELLDELLVKIIEGDFVSEIPEPLYLRLDAYLEQRLEERDSDEPQAVLTGKRR